MTVQGIIAILARHAREFRGAGVTRMAVFGSRARGDEETASDLDVFIRMTDEVKRSGFEYFGHLHTLKERLETLVGLPVDIIVEPIRKPELRKAVEADEIVAFESVDPALRRHRRKYRSYSQLHERNDGSRVRR